MSRVESLVRLHETVGTLTEENKLLRTERDAALLRATKAEGELRDLRAELEDARQDRVFEDR